MISELLELAIGQNFPKGGLMGAARAASPLLEGVAWAGVLSLYIVMAYYQAIMAWVVLKYLAVAAFQPGDVPWGDTPESAQRYFDEGVLDLCPAGEDFGAGAPGAVVGPLVGVLALQVAATLAACIKGVSSVQEVVLVTVPLPVLTILMLVFMGASEKGAEIGLREYLGSWNSARLEDSSAWDAGAQSFYSLSLAVGTMPIFAALPMLAIMLPLLRWPSGSRGLDIYY